MPFVSDVIPSQTRRYADFYGAWKHLEHVFRFDIRYRCRRLHDVLRALEVPVDGARVLDVGFGGGDLLTSFPHGCRLTGADISASAVRRARRDRRFRPYASARFHVLREDACDALPDGPFDLVISSHTLEHVPDDRAVLRAMHARLRPGGWTAVFVPIEEPDYIRFHLRAYSLQSIHERILQAGFDVLHTEGSMHINGHVWKLLTIPSRRRWPALGPAVDALRCGTLSLLPYSSVLRADRTLDRLGVGPRQALVVARKPAEARRDAQRG